MKQIDSDALGILNKSLGLTGSGSQITELTDGIVEQNLDVVPIIRRGRTQVGTGGLYTGFWRNIHGAADAQTSSLFPYAVPTSQVRAPFPANMPEQFDVWLFHASVIQLSGSGTLSATLNLVLPATRVGMTTTGGGAEATFPLAFWDALITEGVEFGLLAGSGVPVANLNMRIPRGRLTELQFTSTSSAIATFDLFALLGVFPVALGQDCAV